MFKELFWREFFCQTFGNFTSIIQTAFAPIFFCQKSTILALSREKLLKTLSYKKDARKMLVKLTPGGNLIKDIKNAIPVFNFETVHYFHGDHNNIV